MAEEVILTVLIGFALLLNVLGFVFFAMSLKGEKENIPQPIAYEKDYDLSMNKPEEPTNSSYQFKTIEDEYEEDYKQFYQPVAKEKEEDDVRYQYEPSPPLKPEKEIEPIQEKVYTPAPVEEPEEAYNPYQHQPTEKYQPTYEEKGTEDQEKENPYQFRYEPAYMTEEELNTTAKLPEEKEETIRPTAFQLDLTQEVDYKDEVRQTEDDELENQPKFEGDYQFKHAYSKEERYKYEYEDEKDKTDETTPKVEEKEEEKEEFDYDIDIDKEHEKYYGSEEEIPTFNRYELYLQKTEEKEEEKEEDQLLAKARRNRATNDSTERKMFQTVDLEHVPETPLDREEREVEEMINIKQFEPKKYEKQALDSVVEKSVDEFDDDEMDRRIEYLMGKMHDPFQAKKKKDPLDEEF